MELKDVINYGPRILELSLDGLIIMLIMLILNMLEVLVMVLIMAMVKNIHLPN